jgi:hypothetical protein
MTIAIGFFLGGIDMDGIPKASFLTARSSYRDAPAGKILKMNKAILSVVVFAALSVGGTATATSTVTFNDISVAGNAYGLEYFTSLIDGGMSFTCQSVQGCQVLDPAVYSTYIGGGSGYTGALLAGETNVLATNGISMGLPGSGAFTLGSFDMAAAWRNNLQVVVTGYNGASAVDSDTVTLGNAGVQSLLTLNWTGLTSVTITPNASTGTASSIYTYGGGTDGIGVDNITYSTGSPVPLPASAWLMLSALGGMGLLARRRAGTVMAF